MKYNTHMSFLDELENIIQSGEDNDWWFGIDRNDNTIGADFNYYKDCGEVNCAIYAAWPDNTEDVNVLSIDTGYFEDYMLDPSDPEWKEKLIQTMIDFCERRLKEGRK